MSGPTSCSWCPWAGTTPQHQPPDGFPTPPPRVGATLQASSAVTIKGELYAARVPRAAMGGFELALRFDVGGAFRIEAWLTSRAHLLVQWDPFFVDGTVGVRVGVAATVQVLFVKVRISLELGVDLSFWGRDDWPFGGVAQIKVWLASFRIPFGSERKGAPPINWDDFAIQLPRPVKVNLEDGQALPDRYSPLPDRWVRDGTEDAPTLVTSQGFQFSTFLSLSANRLELNGNPFPLVEGTPPPKANIRPMGLPDVDSVHKVTLRRKSRPNELYDPWEQDGWVVREYRVDVSQAMWAIHGRIHHRPIRIGYEGRRPRGHRAARRISNRPQRLAVHDFGRRQRPDRTCSRQTPPEATRTHSPDPPARQPQSPSTRSPRIGAPETRSSPSRNTRPTTAPATHGKRPPT
ncbi:DUF6603 domain-containing protein [Streptomyces lavendulae]|uniref:DUF6603 domain-containing protein n=1 Tax=Streptomyces lavendulae TaxID=1914 RepID=UPI0036C140F6